MSLQQFCQRPVICTTPEQTVVEACQLLRNHNVGCLVVEEEGKLCGIVTDRDLALKVIGTDKDPASTSVREVMTPDPVHISANHSLHTLTSFMHRHQVRRVPIVDTQGKVIGMVTLDDLLILLGKELSDMGQGIAAAVLRKPIAHEDIPPPEWMEAYLCQPAA